MFGLVEKSSGLLFSSTSLSDIIQNQRLSMRNEVERMDGNRLLNTSPADLVKYLIEKYSIEAPILCRENWSASECETQVDVRYDRSRYIRDATRPCLVPGQRIEIEVPIQGDIQLLYAQATTSTSAPPRAEIRGSSLFIIYNIPHDAPQSDLKQKTEKVLDEIEQHLSWIQSDLRPYAQNIAAEAEQIIKERKNRILANQGRVSSLGIPIKTRADAPKTYAVPEIRRRVIPILPQATNKPYEPEPVLDMANYEHILSVAQKMAHVMERSPTAFKTMGEEDLRQHFLVQLNGQFEGAATGETFNVKGKTDILLREKDRNVFIAECKFWKGPKHYRETIDQLLGYTAWRDTKTAIFVFNRGTTLTTVLSGIQAETVVHNNFKRALDWKHETGFRYVFHHESDANREFLLTVLVFDVPGPEKE
ncbi:MAG: hypothetical protein CVV42_17310 [Candidatus Riflebacteria bacterium HGW-Riflebacteria-2]|jgi:hypothetical protein|nr:MAG: hypothetical protein CVV42_17310 [Candidatus Riflebacteria bacterium HGW-Riflebacteria-2]